MELNSIIEEIKNYNNRESAEIYIKSLKLNKGDLIKIGRIAHAHSTAKDNKDKIIYWIIEAIIGSKLRTEAVAEIDLSK